MHDARYRIGGLEIVLRADTERFITQIRKRFESYESTATTAPDAIIEFSDMGSEWKIDRPYTESWPIAQTQFANQTYSFWRPEFEGTASLADPKTVFGKFEVQFNPYCFETPVRLIACLAGARRGTVFLHSAGALFGDKAVLFTALSGGGKTTTLSLLENQIPLSDEIVAIRTDLDVPFAYATPFTGGKNTAKQASGPIHAICFIHQADKNSITEAARTSAMQRLMRNTLAYVSDAESAGGVLETAIRLTSEHSPVRLIELDILLPSQLASFLEKNLFASPDTKQAQGQ